MAGKVSARMAAAVVVAIMVVVSSSAGGATAACNAGSLQVCAAAITGGATPSAACCSGLRAQQGCFCQFAKDPTYGRFVNTPNARKTVAACGIPVPHCA